MISAKRVSREIRLGKIKIGGCIPPVIQTMITTPLESRKKALDEAMRAYDMGCKVVRTAYKNDSETADLKNFVKKFPGEVIADIHFNYKLALAAIDAGVSGIRINPGNIGGREKITEVIESAKKRPELAVRVGVNGGSLEKDIINKYGGVTPAGLAESTVRWVQFIENELKFFNFKISVKSNSVPDTIDSCRKVAAFTDAPFHAGITEAGGGMQGVIKSAVGIGLLFSEGLADTFRVSLTAPIEDEIKTGMYILKACGLLHGGAEIISCPTCGRTHGEIFKYFGRLEKWFDDQKWWLKPELKVALMGCEVNGPGEAREADIGIALGKDCALFMEHGDIIKKFGSQDEAFEFLLDRIPQVWNKHKK